MSSAPHSIPRVEALQVVARWTNAAIVLVVDPDPNVVSEIWSDLPTDLDLTHLAEVETHARDWLAHSTEPGRATFGRVGNCSVAIVGLSGTERALVAARGTPAAWSESEGQLLAFAADLLAADQVANGMVPPGPEDAELTAELTHAATNGELRLLFQPEVDLWTRRIVAAECLLRWEHPRLGLLEPARFIQLAERAGAMDTLGTWVVDTAIAQLATWSGASVAAGLSLRVNISPSQFAHRDVAGLVGAALARHHVPGRRLCVEITETAPLPPLDLAARTIEALHQVGVATAIDDWGTGYSRLSQLRVLPVDAVKLDRSFVTDLHVDPRAAAIVRGLIGLAASLDLTVVAEGVETEAEAAALLTYGCSRAQGHLFGAAMSADALESRLSEAAAARPLT